MFTIRRGVLPCPSVVLSSCAVSLALACSAEPGAESGDGAPPFFGPGNGNGQPPAGAGGTGAQAQPGNGSAGSLGSGLEQPGSNPALGGEQTGGNSQNVGGAGGSGTAVGTAGSTMVAMGGSSMQPPQNPPAGSGCADAAFFCEDFDTLNPGPLTGVTAGLQPERTVSIIAEPGRGQVLQVQAGPGYGAKAGVFLNDFSAPNNSYYGRMFARVAQFPVADGDHWVLVEATGAGSNEQVRPVGGQFQRWAPGSDGPSANDWTDWQQSSATTAAGAWECVEWQMDGSNGNNDIVLWVDGTEVRPIERANFSFPVINRLWFGWVVYQNGAPPQYDVRLDDIVLSTERIGCE